jgi:hypothetical protein
LATANVRWKSRFNTKPSVPRRFGMTHRLLHLTEDLRLAQHYGVETAGDAEGVVDRLLARQRVNVRRQRVLRDSGENPRAR